MNMGNKKAVFFDIDGTLWDRNNHIPESTIEAIRTLRKNGHLAFLCSGRCRGYIQDPKLLDIGFDGIVSGCGTMVEFGEKVLFYRELETDLMEYTVRTVRQYGFRPILEGCKYLYMDDIEFGTDPYGMKLKREMGDRLRSIEQEWGRWEVSKLACATERADRDGCIRVLEKYYDFMIHNEAVLEMVPKGFHKGIGIAIVCDYLEMDMKDTFAFGDSSNDLGMFQDAGIAVAMGNGSDEAKQAADYVTAEMMDDGIWKACRHFDLI